MNLFYVHIQDDSQAFMDESESRHCIKVLRMREGEEIQFIDGKGSFGRGVLRVANPKACVITIQEKIQNYRPVNYQLHIAIAPTKSIDRFEWFIEKATEIGIYKITPLLCEHSERKNLRIDRLERIILSACKQSLKARFPVISPMISFRNFMDTSENRNNQFIAHCRDYEVSHLIQEANTDYPVLLLIGPEGDFSEDEIQEAEKKGFKSVNLGESRLRTETAGIAGVQIIADLFAIKKSGK